MTNDATSPSLKVSVFPSRRKPMIVKVTLQGLYHIHHIGCDATSSGGKLVFPNGWQGIAGSCWVKLITNRVLHQKHL